MNKPTAFTETDDAIGVNLAESLAPAPILDALAWVDGRAGRAIWRYRHDADAEAEARALQYGKLALLAPVRTLQRSEIAGGRTLLLTPMPFAHEESLAGIAASSAEEALAAMGVAANNLLRARIGALMKAGLPNRQDEFPETDTQFNALITHLRSLQPDDLMGRLSYGGFKDHPVGEGADCMRCQECIYYLPNRKWCDLPELPVPVEAEWYCRLWKV